MNEMGNSRTPEGNTKKRKINWGGDDAEPANWGGDDAEPTKKVKVSGPKFQPKESKPKPALSILEQLPPEILSKIHLLSDTPTLPLVSPGLMDKLDSDHSKTQLVQRYFAHPEYTRHYERQFVDAQSTILRMKWLTWEFFRKCQKGFMLKTAAKALREHMINHPVENRVKGFMDLKSRLDRAFELGGTMAAYYERLRMERDNTPVPSRDLKLVLFEMPGLLIEITPISVGNLCHLTITKSANGKKTEKTLKCMPANPRDYLEHKPTKPWNTDPLRHFMIPSKLLHGQWTQERGDFLCMLLSMGARVGDTNDYNYELAEQGLLDAIEQRCEPAIRVLTLGLKGNYLTPYQEESAVADFFQRRVTIYNEEIAPDPSGPWIDDNQYSAFDRYYNRREPIVRPTATHVIAALDSALHDLTQDCSLMAELASQMFDTGRDVPEIITWAEGQMVQERARGDYQGLGRQVLRWYRAEKMKFSANHASLLNRAGIDGFHQDLLDDGVDARDLVEMQRLPDRLPDFEDLIAADHGDDGSDLEEMQRVADLEDLDDIIAAAQRGDPRPTRRQLPLTQPVQPYWARNTFSLASFGNGTSYDGGDDYATDPFDNWYF